MKADRAGYADLRGWAAGFPVQSVMSVRHTVKGVDGDAPIFQSLFHVCTPSNYKLCAPYHATRPALLVSVTFSQYYPSLASHLPIHISVCFPFPVGGCIASPTPRALSQPGPGRTAFVRQASGSSSKKMAPFPKPNSDPPKHEMQYFPSMTTALPSESGEFRRVLWTGLYSQVVLMTIPVGGDIGDEVSNQPA